MVNRDQVAGVAKQIKGSVKQAAGKATGNRRTQVEGMADKIAGKVQKAYGDVKAKVKKAF
ncbi:CsbD family protein [Mesorhizobium sp. NZP2077]|uniref:CsbD family protein n=1 Tax=Mesorhizobium sp. NZP2077 TaxID=2483404 RepID=UPI00159ACC4E|nr:CsbD family protein [Mesorhizobium sp. NZP2077]QKC84528.1 CsbD family protein [Mesorhizobium sp. NZP2077]